MMNPNDLMIRFRKLAPFQQTAVLGVMLFIVYNLYALLVSGLTPLEAARESLYSTLLFMVVFYFTSAIIMRKSMQASMQSKGPKKGLRGK